MTQIAQLSEAEIEARFHVAGERPVAFMLAGFAKEYESFSVQFGDGEAIFLTTLLAVQPERGRFVFDCSGSEELNRRLLGSEHLVFVGRPGGIHVQFSTGRAAEIAYGGSKAFTASLPKYLVRLQRREYFRIDTPRIRPVEFFGRLPEGGLLRLAAHDLSVAGIGLTAASPPDGLATGVELANCRISLPDDEQDLFCGATVRHVTRHESRGVGHWRVGLEFKDLAAGEENRIQRYIARLERERHELT